ncbi:hypothetical protein C8R43DRAFT_482404 [Mycena crocata]|nr:hypothetical protein C8R43DRAFT_482404 [Mycena crocata]
MGQTLFNASLSHPPFLVAIIHLVLDFSGINSSLNPKRTTSIARPHPLFFFALTFKGFLFTKDWQKIVWSSVNLQLAAFRVQLESPRVQHRNARRPDASRAVQSTTEPVSLAEVKSRKSLGENRSRGGKLFSPICQWLSRSFASILHLRATRSYLSRPYFCAPFLCEHNDTTCIQRADAPDYRGSISWITGARDCMSETCKFSWLRPIGCDTIFEV